MFSHDVAQLLNILTFSCSTADISFACYHIFRIFSLFPFCIKSLFTKKKDEDEKKKIQNSRGSAVALEFESPHDKTKKMHVRPSKTQISVGIHSV